MKDQSHRVKKKCQIWTRLAVSRLYLQFEFNSGYEMINKAWRSIEEVPYRFSRSSIKFEGHTAVKNVEFDPNGAFQD